MSLQILSVASPLVSLFFFSAFVVAGINVTAGCLPSFSWVCILWFQHNLRHLYNLMALLRCIQAFNSLGQSPCTVAAYMLATCYSGCEFSSRLRARALWSHLPCSLYSHTAADGICIWGPEGWLLQQVRVQYSRIFTHNCMRHMPRPATVLVRSQCVPRFPRAHDLSFPFS